MAGQLRDAWSAQTSPLIWLLTVAALLYYGWISHERMSERELMFYATAFFWLFGLGFLLAHWYGDTSSVLGFLVKWARGRRRWRPSLYRHAKASTMAPACLGLGFLPLCYGLFFAS